MRKCIRAPAAMLITKFFIVHALLALSKSRASKKKITLYKSQILTVNLYSNTNNATISNCTYELTDILQLLRILA